VSAPIEIDTMTGGMTKVTAGYLIPARRPALIECGPALSIEHTIEGLRAHGLDPDDLAYLVVSHLHLDHAGGAGDIARAFPGATIVVSEIGARHLSDPERLNDSARRVYGAFFDSVYGPCTPIQPERVRGVDDGDIIDLGGGRTLQVIATPGHAKHHIGILDRETGDLFTGDSVGVRLPGMRAIRPATPPSDFHLEAALASLGAYRRVRPSRLFLAHYGPVDPPDEALAEADERLRSWAQVAEEAFHESDELEHITSMLTARFADDLEVAHDDEGGDPDAQARLSLLNDVRSNAAGLLRYLRRKADGTLTPTG